MNLPTLKRLIDESLFETSAKSGAGPDAGSKQTPLAHPMLGKFWGPGRQ